MRQSHRVLLIWARLLHVYLTLFGLVLLLFFAITGFMLNHEDWFSPAEPARHESTGKLPADILGKPEDRAGIEKTLRDDFGADGDVEEYRSDDEDRKIHIVFKGDQGTTTAVIQRTDGQLSVAAHPGRERSGKLPAALLDIPENRLAIVEFLRTNLDARGALDSFDHDRGGRESFRVVFKSPGHFAEATIQRDTGETVVKHESRGIVAIALDLHRGKTSGLAWSAVIDGVSILFVIVSITGLILWSSLRGRAQHGILVLTVGLALSLAVYFLFVPR